MHQKSGAAGGGGGKEGEDIDHKFYMNSKRGRGMEKLISICIYVYYNNIIYFIDVFHKEYLILVRI